MTLPAGWAAVKDAVAGPEAALLGDRLEQHGIPVYLRYLRDLPGLEAGVVVAVPDEWLERARTLLGEDGVSEGELDSLAMERPVESAFTIRRAAAADAAEIARLFDLYRQFYEQPADAARAHAFIGARFDRKDSVIFIAARGGELVGFTQLYPALCSVAAAPFFVLYDLFVAPEARRTGAARALMQAAAHYAKGTGAVRLELATAKNNHAAQALYQSLGWVRDDVFDHYSLSLED